MTLNKIKHLLHDEVYEILKLEGIDELRPSQRKSIDAGLFENKNLLKMAIGRLTNISLLIIFSLIC